MNYSDAECHFYNAMIGITSRRISQNIRRQDVDIFLNIYLLSSINCECQYQIVITKCYRAPRIIALDGISSTQSVLTRIQFIVLST